MNKTVFVATSEIREQLKQLEQDSQNEWINTKADFGTFDSLAQKLIEEIVYLEGFWGDDRCVDLRRFYKWNCEQAYYDMTPESQDYAANRGKYKCFYLGFDKFNVFHERQSYLENLYSQLCRLFHDWQFCTQGWTAY